MAELDAFESRTGHADQIDTGIGGSLHASYYYVFACAPSIPAWTETSTQCWAEVVDTRVYYGYPNALAIDPSLVSLVHARHAMGAVEIDQASCLVRLGRLRQSHLEGQVCPPRSWSLVSLAAVIGHFAVRERVAELEQLRVGALDRLHGEYLGRVGSVLQRAYLRIVLHPTSACC
ncbi:uncharacterized protein PG998_001299 [Apiospora kogelbergensis]|uniref:uncharacterized protein n=1 Tax=Apiospora kogelbergensis TaxID=1337665 RepID=UPI00312FFA31